MRRLLLGSMALLTVALMCLAAKPGASLRLERDVLDLGGIEKDSVATGTVKFYNDGTEPLVITSIFSDCHCTVPSYTEYPVEPGDSGIIAVKFSTRGREPGSFRKAVRIRSNADNTIILFVKGRVKRQYRK